MAVNILNRYTGATIVTIAGSTLAGVTLSGYNLTDADFNGKDLTGTIFTGAVCAGADFRSSNCTNASFFRANIERADFTGATLSNTRFLCSFRDGATITFPTPKPVRVIHYHGQSNAAGVNSSGEPGGLPLAAVRFYVNIIGTYDSAGFIDLDTVPGGEFGGELALGIAMDSADYDVAIIKICAGATTMSDWVATSATFTTLKASFLDAISKLEAEFGVTRDYRFYGFWWLGEDDVRFSGGSGIPTYATNFRSFSNGIAQLISQRCVWHVVLTQSWIASPVPGGLTGIRSEETEVATRTMNVDAVAHNVDNVHASAAGLNDFGTNIMYPSFLLSA